MPIVLLGVVKRHFFCEKAFCSRFLDVFGFKKLVKRHSALSRTPNFVKKYRFYLIFIDFNDISTMTQRGAKPPSGGRPKAAPIVENVVPSTP